ncbi:hypothetical protein ACEWY4_015556 [Coilia grayii]|uniref:Uncharacterized protein n=1 Tax=Coilia grayii TaxID=363190 RepID=A0ABD1JNG4_9TELE
MKDYVSQLKQCASEHATGLTAITVVGFGLLALRRWMAGGVCRSKARLDGKTVLITGANTGIGKETAVDLAGRGARVILACRDLGRAERAAGEIRKRSGNGNVVVKQLDLASLQSVRTLATDLTASEERLDILINNAGIMMCPKWRTEEGFEMQFGVNHLGHFLLTNSLLELLKKSAPSRVVTVSSLAHEKGEIHFEDINLDKDYDPLKSYRQSKLANVLFTRELSRRLSGSGVTVYSLHPGVIRTELGRHLSDSLPPWRRLLLAPLMLLWPLIKSPWEGAQTTIYCAVDHSLHNTCGLYYSTRAITTTSHDRKACTRAITTTSHDRKACTRAITTTSHDRKACTRAITSTKSNCSNRGCGPLSSLRLTALSIMSASLEASASRPLPHIHRPCHQAGEALPTHPSPLPSGWEGPSYTPITTALRLGRHILHPHRPSDRPIAPA